jgi:hypothetical protein
VHVLVWHAVGAAEIAAVGDRYAQVMDLAAKTVLKRLRHGT